MHRASLHYLNVKKNAGIQRSQLALSRPEWCLHLNLRTRNVYNLSTFCNIDWMEVQLIKMLCFQRIRFYPCSEKIRESCATCQFREAVRFRGVVTQLQISCVSNFPVAK